MLAIIIPYFKLSFLEETLISLKNQLDKRFIVYLIDDSSPENPINLINKYKEDMELRYTKFEENIGGQCLVSQWNRCLNILNDEYWVMFLGDDDVLGKNVVSEFYKNEEKIRGLSSVVRFSTQKINSKSESISEVFKHPVLEKSTDFLFRKTRSSLSEYIFKKEMIDNHGFKKFPLAWFSDVLAVLEFSNFKNVFTINNGIVYVRISKLSISGSTANEEFKAKARFQFYYYLVSKKINHFSMEQRKEIFYRLNKSYINDKKNLNYFFKLTKYYLKTSSFKDYIGFIKQINKAVFHLL